MLSEIEGCAAILAAQCWLEAGATPETKTARNSTAPPFDASKWRTCSQPRNTNSGIKFFPKKQKSMMLPCRAVQPCRVTRAAYNFAVISCGCLAWACLRGCPPRERGCKQRLFCRSAALEFLEPGNSRSTLINRSVTGSIIENTGRGTFFGEGSGSRRNPGPGAEPIRAFPLSTRRGASAYGSEAMPPFMEWCPCKVCGTTVTRPCWPWSVRAGCPGHSGGPARPPLFHFFVVHPCYFWCFFSSSRGATMLASRQNAGLSGNMHQSEFWVGKHPRPNGGRRRGPLCIFQSSKL